MALIGNRKDAKFISDWYHEKGYLEPEGWKNVGSGSYRTAWLHVESNVVYKVDEGDYADAGWGSKDEVRNAQSLYRLAVNGILSPNLRIPKTSGFRFGAMIVVAMEMIKGVTLDYSSDEYEQGRLELFKIGKFQDMHAANYMVDEEGYVVPIDMASPRNAWPDTRVISGTPEYDKENARRFGRF